MWSVFFVFLSYLDRNFVKGDFLSQESKEMFSMLNGTFCAKMSTVRENFLYQVSDGAEVVRSAVSPAGKLVDCSVIEDRMQVKSFMHECRLGLKEQRAARQLETRFARMDEAKLRCQEFKERSERSDSVEVDQSHDSAPQNTVLKRLKRGFTYPGTLWCGAGNMADHDDQLGEFAETDSCCRIHDHCPHVIHAFSSKYGYTNFKWHSVCHCDCDNTLKECLRKVNDTSSRVVGQAFFNVIGVPCFDFVYEEQCAERHWYGMCKRYEKFPLAALRESVPYDFGGIEVIDELPLSSHKKSKKEEAPESATQSAMPEPSLRNVVTAAEDFIKVLATVSTSHSSAADGDKGETQSSEKKKRKNSGKKKKKKTAKTQKGKGKGRKRKQKAEAGLRSEEAPSVSTSGGKAEDANALSNFISESHRHEQPSRKEQGVGDTEYELGGKEEPSNDVMKDEPAMDKETEKNPAGGETQKGKRRRLRKGGRKKKKSKTAHLSSAQLPVNPTDISVPTEPRLLPNGTETPSLSPKAKRNRSKERGDRGERKRRRKGSSASSIVAAANQSSSADSRTGLPLSGAPRPSTERRVSHRPGADGRETNATFSVLKRQKSREGGARNGRRNAARNRSESALPVVQTPETSDGLSPTTAAALWATEGTGSHSAWRLFTAATPAPYAVTKRHRQTMRQQRKPRKKHLQEAPAAASLKRTEQTTPVWFTTAPPKGPGAEEATTGLQRSEKTSMTTATTPPVLSPIQMSIEKVKAQFSRKKRRKAALMRQ